jgi:hypothetical protein
MSFSNPTFETQAPNFLPRKPPPRFLALLLLRLVLPLIPASPASQSWVNLAATCGTDRFSQAPSVSLLRVIRVDRCLATTCLHSLRSPLVFPFNNICHNRHPPQPSPTKVSHYPYSHVVFCQWMLSILFASRIPICQTGSSHWNLGALSTRCSLSVSQLGTGLYLTSTSIC